MASPANAIDRLDLSISFEEFDEIANMKGYIGTRVLTKFGSQKESGTYPVIPLEAMLTSKDTRRAGGAPYGRDDFKTEDEHFNCVERGWEGVIDDKKAKMYGNPEKYASLVARRTAATVMDDIERQVAAAVYNTTTWTGSALTTAVGTAWTTVASATPIKNIHDAMESMFLSSGQEANAVVMNTRQAQLITECAEYQGRFVATDRKQNILEANLAQVIGVKHVIIAGASKNTANPKQTPVIARLWGNGNVMVCKIAESDDLEELCIGRTIFWTGEVPQLDGDMPYAVIAEQYRDEPVRGGIHRVRTNMIWKIMSAACGHLLTGVSA